MKKDIKLFVCMCVLAISSTLCATPNAWVSTRYSTNSSPYYSSSYRSPVTDGFVDVMLFVDNFTCTDLEFSVIYDTNLVDPITILNIPMLMAGFTVDSVTNVPVSADTNKAIIAISGDVTVDQTQYISDAIMYVRFFPKAEGTMPIGLWQSEWTKYPESYQTCSLSIEDDGIPVDFEPKEWNDEIILFTFTDKTNATLLYQYDYNFGNPLTDGSLFVTYSDDSVQEFTAASPGDNTIATEFGGYFINPQPNAVSYKLVLPGYYDQDSLNLTGGQGVTHSQPSGYFDFEEIMNSDFGVLEASDTDRVLTIVQPGLGADFASHQFTAAVAGQACGVLGSPISMTVLNDDTIELTISGGLQADYYNLYLYRDNVVYGSAMFEVAMFHDVIFTVQYDKGKYLPYAIVYISTWGMDGSSTKQYQVDDNGQVTISMPGNQEWGANYNYHVTAPGYANYDEYVDVFGLDVEVLVFMEPAESVNVLDFAELASWWNNPDCSWDDNCNGFDLNYDNTVDTLDLAVFIQQWLSE